MRDAARRFVRSVQRIVLLASRKGGATFSRMLKGWLAWWGASLVALAACGGSTDNGGSSGGGTGGDESSKRQALDAADFCTRLIDECGDRSATREACEQRFRQVRVSKTCADGYKTTACADIVKSGGLCFPTCKGDAPKCNEDASITTCTTDNRLVTFDCAAVCVITGLPYTGVCGESYGGQRSDDGRARCWCE